MNKWQKGNLIVFVSLVLVTSSLVYLFGSVNETGPFGKPWHLLPSVHEDSLSQDYVEKYCILNSKSLLLRKYDSTRVNVFVLVDAWGVPIDEEILADDMGYFEGLPHIYALHQRLANRTKHAERVEFRNDVANSIYLFGGDSLEYNRSSYLNELGLKKTLFCQKCGDDVMVAKLDSLLENDSLQMIAWTTQSSRSGDRDSLRNSLKLIADLVARHPNIQFVVQGTHRPVLGTSETRNSYKSHWVPAVILNAKR